MKMEVKKNRVIDRYLHNISNFYIICNDKILTYFDTYIIFILTYIRYLIPIKYMKILTKYKYA